MKKYIYILNATLLLLLFACDKEENEGKEEDLYVHIEDIIYRDNKAQSIRITLNKIDSNWDLTNSNIQLELSENNKFESFITYPFKEASKNCSITLTDLKNGTDYWYRYRVYIKDKNYVVENYRRITTSFRTTSDISFTVIPEGSGGCHVVNGNFGEGVESVSNDKPHIIKAESKREYVFSHWDNGDTSLTRSITINSDTTFTAYFVKINTTDGVSESGKINGFGYVDLALPSGVLWATENVGASSKEEQGDYFSWGEVSSKRIYSLENYKHYRIDTIIINGFEKYNKGYTKYIPANYKDEQGYNGIYDDKIELDDSDDAARITMGFPWRTPSEKEYDELINFCTWEWSTYKGHKGYKIVGRNGNWIFLPAAGLVKEYKQSDNTYGYYWTRGMYLLYNFYPIDWASCIHITENYSSPTHNYREIGMSIRGISQIKN